MQHEITRVCELLDEKGNIAEPGYAKRLLPIYRRSAIRAGRLRIKEWDYYLVSNGHIALALTIADNSYMALDSVSLINLDERWEVTKSPMRIMPMGKTGLPETSARGVTKIAGKGYSISFTVEGGKRTLICHMDDFKDGRSIDAHVVLSDEPEESMVIATPFSRDRYFYYNQKINCMRAYGTVDFGGTAYVFDPAESFGTLDWGRGVWTYRNTWYWGSGSGLADGVPFGFNIGYGFGDTSAASENMLFYDGAAHKLSQVTFNIPMKNGREDYMSPWTFTSDDGRFEMDFEPVIDRASNTDFVVLGSNQHQVFGLFSGRAVLDDGRVIELERFPGFAEKVANKW